MYQIVIFIDESLSSISGININNNRYEKLALATGSSIPSSSYGSSFSENVGIIGNQIQISGENFGSPQPKDNSLLENFSDSVINNNKFTLKFSEKELKEYLFLIFLLIFC